MFCIPVQPFLANFPYAKKRERERETHNIAMLLVVLYIPLIPESLKLFGPCLIKSKQVIKSSQNFSLHKDYVLNFLCLYILAVMLSIHFSFHPLFIHLIILWSKLSKFLHYTFSLTPPMPMKSCFLIFMQKVFSI